MFRRRRPLARAAVVGGAAYAVGRRSGRNNAEEQYDQQAPPPPPDDVGLPDSAYDELEKLAKLKDKGILTQEEFDDQKAKILEGG